MARKPVWNRVYLQLHIEDLYRKGENQFDYANWDGAIKRKAVTGTQVLQILKQSVTRKGDAVLMAQLLHKLTNEYQLTSTAHIAIQRSFQRYYEQRLSARTLLLKDVAASGTRMRRVLKHW